jgi:uncharacterized protein YyaL (SSP411 family)
VVVITNRINMLQSYERLQSCCKYAIVAIAVLFLGQACSAESPEAKTGPWRNWDDEVFQQASKEKKLVLLDLEARWCHWCHVMDAETYSNSEVAALLNKHFILVRVDQDARPDLSARYRDYGWPATILFDGKGSELRKLAGFQSAEEFVPILKEVVRNPKPMADEQQSTSAAPLISALDGAIRAKLLERYLEAIDKEAGGLKTSHRYLDPDSIEYALTASSSGDQISEDWVRKTLQNNRKLMDPVWGGVFQYSTHRDWDHPHFEKIMPSQIANMRMYAYAYRLWGDEADLKVATSIASYLNIFLRDEDGAYFTSQDADVVAGQHSDSYFSLPDTERRAQGVPAIDRHQYARENGMAIVALTDLYLSAGQRQYLEDAERAAQWAIDHRSISGGGFQHGESSTESPYLTDSLWMGRGFLGLYAATSKREWLSRAQEVATFIAAEFANPRGAGFFSTQPRPKETLPPVLRLDENLALARFANELFRYTGDAAYRSMSLKAFSYCAQPEVFLETISEPGIILAGDEIANDPPHFTTVGSKSDRAAGALFTQTLKLPRMYVRREWWDRAEGAMPNPDVQYPMLPKAAAFVCANKRCSLPIFSTDELLSRIDQVFKPR